MATWSTRIKSRMKDLGLTQEILARKMGITRGAITHYLAGRRVPPLKQFQKLAAILKADPAWLQFGTTEIKPLEKMEKPKLASCPIPILSWSQVAEFVNIKKLKREEIKEFLQHFNTDKPHWYGLRVRGDAMTSPLGNSKSFHEGDIIIVDPEKTITHGSYVIAILPRSNEATFKQFVIDGGIHYLKPLNPQYPIIKIDDSTHIYGAVIAHISF